MDEPFVGQTRKRWCAICRAWTVQRWTGTRWQCGHEIPTYASDNTGSVVTDMCNAVAGWREEET